MFELADYLVGIYKVEDCTHSVTIQNYDKQRVLGLGEKESEKENQDGNQTLDNTTTSCRSPQIATNESQIVQASQV
jgi:hypothetical protein